MQKKRFQTDWSSAFKKMKDQNGGKKNFTDERIYKPEVDDSGTAKTIIRFLPSPDTDVPYVEVFSHYFKDVGGWYIDNCPTTKGNDCPVCKENSRIWDDDPDTVRRRKRKRNFYSNILIVDDKQNPANNGKVFLFKYGIKIQEKIMELIEDEGIMPFDYYEGANFELKIKMQKVGAASMPNYDSSHFKDASSVGTDEEIEKINEGLHPLAPFVADDKFKSFNDLEEKLMRVIGEASKKPATPKPEPTPAPSSTDDDDDDVFGNVGTSDDDDTTSDDSDDSMFGEEDDEAFFNDIENE